jgi:hypothetical protein
MEILERKIGNRFLGGLLLLSGMAWAQGTNVTPAARVHVKIVGANALKYESKLAHVVELNFTFGNTHRPGKTVIRDALDRIARDYAIGGTNAFTVRHISSSLDGSSVGEVPNFTVTDLLAGQVIVANNISYFGDAALGSAKQNAIRQAIEADGRGYVAYHGSGDNNRTGWSWYTSTLHPMNYAGHGDRTDGPVYKHLAEANHVVLQGVLTTGTTARTVPNELNAGGQEVLANNVPTRMMKNEWYRFGRDISRDAAFRDNVTILLKYDPRNLGAALPDQYRRLGGNLYTYLYKVGNGLTMYIPAGHENDELLAPGSSFDGGTGDYDRYVAQSLFFLAGYNASVCNPSCNGLPIVDANNRLTGQPYTPNGILPHPGKPGFTFTGDGAFEATVSNVSGRVVRRLQGAGKVRHEFETAGLNPGVYVLRLKTGSSAPVTQKYLVTTAPR